MTDTDLIDLLLDRFRLDLSAIAGVGHGSVDFVIGGHHYRATTALELREIADGIEVKTLGALYQQGVLRGGKRDVAGKLVEVDDEVRL